METWRLLMKALSDILPLLTVFPYALLYYLALLCASLLAALALRRSSARAQSGAALRLSLVVIFASQLLLLTLSLLIHQGYAGLARFFPPVFHTLTLLTLIWLSAGLLTERLSGRLTNLLIFLSGLDLLAGALSVFAWSTWPAEKPFSGSALSLAWSAAALLVLLIALLLALRGKRPHRLERVLVLLIAALGYLVNVLYPAEGQLPSGVMLSQLLYYPLLISAAWQSRRGQDAPRSAASSPQMAVALLDIGLLTRLNEIRGALTHGLALYLMSDLVGILEKDPLVPAFNISSAYDLISETYLPVFQVSFKQIPKLRRHFEDLVPLTANAGDELSGEKQALMRASGFNATGPLLLFPIGTGEEPAKLALLCLNPYTQRAWTNADLDALTPLTEKLIRILGRAAAVETDSALKDESRFLANQTEREKRDLADALSASQSELNTLLGQRADDQAAYAAELRVRAERQKYLEARLEALEHKLRTQQEDLSELDALRQQKTALELSLQENEQRALSLHKALENARAALGDLLNKASPPQETQTTPQGAGAQLAAEQEALQHRLDELALSFYSRRAALRSDLSALPDISQPTYSLLQQVLEQLAINAFAAAPPESEVNLKVGAACCEDGTAGLEILISHAGAGLTTGEQKRLPGLLLGEQAEPPAGVGDFGALREAARLLRESGGHWWVKSKPGGLTDWRALFPIEADARPVPPENV